MKTWSFEDRIAFVLVCIGAAFRFYNYNDWSLSNDELSAITRLNFTSFGQMIEQGVKLNDMHPIGVQSFLWIWTGLFGVGETMLRLPFVILGILSIILFYLVGKKLFGSFPALLATSVFVALEFPILYSQLARPYSPGLFFSLLILFAWSKIIWNEKAWTWKYAFVFVVAGVGCMYTHYFSFLFAAIVGLSGLLLIRKEHRLKYIACGLLMFLIYIPNLDVFTHQFSIGGLGGDEGWLGAPGKDALWNYVLYCFNDSAILLGLLLALVGLAGFTQKTKLKWNRKHTLILILFSVPALIAYFYSIFNNPVFQYSILLFSFPCLLFFIFSWVGQEYSKKMKLVFVFTTLVLTSYSTIFDKQFYSTQFFAPFKDVAVKIAEYNKKYGSEKTIATVNVINPNYIHYYSDRYNDSPKFAQYLCNRAQQFIELKSIVDTSQATTMIHAWSNNYHAPEVEMIIAEKFPYVVENDQFFNAGVMAFSKDSLLHRAQTAEVLFEMKNDFEEVIWPDDAGFRNDSLFFNGKWSMLLKSEQEYSSTFRASANNIGFAKGRVYQASCKFHSIGELKDLIFVISIARKGENILWRGVQLKDFQDKNESWSSFYVGYKLAETILPDDEVSIYFMNSAHENIWIDDLKFRVLEN